MEPIFSTVDSREGITAEIEAHFQRHDEKFLPPLSARGGLDGYLDSLFSMDGRLVLCHIEEKLAGVVGFGLDHPQWKTYFQYIAIDTEYQGRGLPKKMVEYAIDLAVAAGETRIVARTWSTNRVMLRFFALEGFIHFDTLYSDRGEGVHTLLFTKLVVPPDFEKPVQRLGIIGGMGTYSTGNFIRTLSSIPRSVKKEQDLLPFVLVNEPTIPDRTESILNDRLPQLITKVNEAIRAVHTADVSHILFLCFTLHPYIDQLNIPVSVERIDLIAIVARMMKNNTRRTLLVATKGTYRNRLFYDFGFVFPGEQHIDEIHSIIMEIKSGMEPAYYQHRVAAYAAAYGCQAIVLGCTDLHGMFGYARKCDGVEIIDPLLELTLLLQTARNNQKRMPAAAKPRAGLLS